MPFRILAPAAAALFLLLTAPLGRAEDHFPPVILHAGPISLEYKDGQLRYLCVGKKEIVRRVYFGVRDDHWGTIAPVFAQSDVKQSADSFTVRLEAECKDGSIDYTWKGKITGSASGEIVFDVEGRAEQDFKSNRIGLCLLYGAGSLVGQKFETIDDAGKTQQGEFPQLVSPKLVAPKFQKLSYVLPNLMQVEAKMEDATLSMEDQRNYGDTSFKAYAPLKYPYPAVPADGVAHQRLTLSVLGAERAPAPPTITRITLGGPLAGAKAPRISAATPNVEPLDFAALNTHRDTYAAKKMITFRFNPTTHLRDDEMIMENAPAVIDEVRTIRSFAPDASIRVDPVSFDSKVRGTPPDSRAEMPFGAAWTVAMLKALSVAGADEAGFAVNGDPARAVEAEIGKHAGEPLLETKIEGPCPAPIEALAITAGGKRLLWLVNITGDVQEIEVPERQQEPPMQPWEVRSIELAAK